MNGPSRSPLEGPASRNPQQAERSLDALLDMVPTAPENLEFAKNVCAKLPPLARPTAPPSKSLWVERIKSWWAESTGSPLKNSVNSPQKWGGERQKTPWSLPVWQPALAALCIVGLGWGFLRIMEPSMESNPPTSQLALSSVRDGEPENFIDTASPATVTLDDAAVIEDLDWILAEWQNDLWTQEDIVLTF